MTITPTAGSREWTLRWQTDNLLSLLVAPDGWAGVAAYWRTYRRLELPQRSNCPSVTRNKKWSSAPTRSITSRIRSLLWARSSG